MKIEYNKLNRELFMTGCLLNLLFNLICVVINLCLKLSLSHIIYNRDSVRAAGRTFSSPPNHVLRQRLWSKHFSLRSPRFLQYGIQWKLFDVSLDRVVVVWRFMTTTSAHHECNVTLHAMYVSFLLPDGELRALKSLHRAIKKNY